MIPDIPNPKPWNLTSEFMKHNLNIELNFNPSNIKLTPKPPEPLDPNTSALNRNSANAYHSHISETLNHEFKWTSLIRRWQQSWQKLTRRAGGAHSVHSSLPLPAVLSPVHPVATTAAVVVAVFHWTGINGSSLHGQSASSHATTSAHWMRLQRFDPVHLKPRNLDSGSLNSTSPKRFIPKECIHSSAISESIERSEMLYLNSM